MKDMSILNGKMIINKETSRVCKVIEIDEKARKIYYVPANEPDAEPSVMAAASYDRRWMIYEEPAAVEADNPAATDADEPAAAEVNSPTVDAPAEDEAMKMSETVKALESIFDKLNVIYFEGKLCKPVITVQTTPKAYGHCSTKKVWTSEAESQYEINLGAEFINRPKDQTCATLLHEMVHLYCIENEIADTCQRGRYHNKTFKAECEARDLTVDYDRTNGYACTAPTDAFRSKLSAAGVDLEKPFAKLARAMPKAKARAERAKARKYICPVCGQEVKSTAELSLICGICNTPMEG